MKKIFKNKKTKILSLRALSFGIMITTVATTAVACSSDNLDKGFQNKKTINVVNSINADALNLTGTAFANLDILVNNTSNFAFKNLNKLVTGDIKFN